MAKAKKERLTAERLMRAAKEIEARPQGYFTAAQLAEETGRDWGTVKAALELMEAEFEQLPKAGQWKVREEPST